MCDQDNNHYTDCGSSTNTETYKNADNLTCVPGWQMPENGLYGIDFWSHMWKRPEKTICEWIKKYKIPFIGVDAKNSYIYARDFLAHVGKIQTDEAE